MTLVTERPERPIVIEWLDKEEAGWQGRKYAHRAGDDQKMKETGLAPDGYWYTQITNYFYRANVLGLDTPVGRQAAAKGVATAIGMLESVIRMYGPLPEPGHSSGEIVKWNRDDS